MSKFIIKTQAYPFSPVYDVKAFGQDVSAVEFSEEAGIDGPRRVFTFEVKNGSELNLTLRKLRGDVELTLPPSWDASVDVISYVDSESRLPKVILTRGDIEVIVGYVTSPTLSIHFFKQRQRYRAGDGVEIPVES